MKECGGGRAGGLMSKNSAGPVTQGRPVAQLMEKDYWRGFLGRKRTLLHLGAAQIDPWVQTCDYSPVIMDASFRVRTT